MTPADTTPDGPVLTAADAVPVIVLRLAAVAVIGLPSPSMVCIHANSATADLTFTRAEDLRVWARAMGAPEVHVSTYIREGDDPQQVTTTTAKVPIGPRGAVYLTHTDRRPALDIPGAPS